MARLPGNPLTFVPAGASDALDGTNSFAGAMRTLANLIPDPSTRGVWVSRTASVEVASNPTFGVPTGMLMVGDILYGMTPSTLNPGFDQPFAYNMLTGAFLPVAGITAANVPASPPASGDWTPPILAQIGSRVVVTHPGFPGGDTKFGWFDISDLSLMFDGDVSNRLNEDTFVNGFFSTFGLEPGLTVSGANIPANTRTVRSFANAMAGYLSSCTMVAGSATISVAELTGFRPGALVYGDGIPAGAVILLRSAFVGAGSVILTLPATKSVTADVMAVLPTSSAPDISTTATSTTATYVVDPGSTARYYSAGQILTNVANLADGTTVVSVDGAGNITLSLAAIGTATFQPTVLASVLQMSAAATGTAELETISITGGTKAAPLWGAGDCNINPLPSVPVGVALSQGGRGLFACGDDGIPFSDPLLPCQRSNANQALLTGDGLAVTAVAPLLLSAPITGGIVQAVIAFEGVNCMRQITGDPATGNLAMNLLPVATGTDAPLSIVPCEKGLAFISPDGLRFIDFAGNVSTPIGDFGRGIVVPFHNAVVPSRICGAAASSVLRFTVQNGAVEGQPYQEWWYDLSLRAWSGPHTFPAALIQRWRDRNVLVGVGIAGTLWSSTVTPGGASATYVENEVVLTSIAETVLVPDNAQVMMNKMVEANIACAGVRQINVQVFDEYGNVLDYVGVPIGSGNSGVFRQRAINWSRPILFKQMRQMVVAQADQTLRIGNFYWRFQPLPYNIGDDEDGPDLLSDTGDVLTDDAGAPITVSSSP